MRAIKLFLLSFLFIACEVGGQNITVTNSGTPVAYSQEQYSSVSTGVFSAATTKGSSFTDNEKLHTNRFINELVANHFWTDSYTLKLMAGLSSEIKATLDFKGVRDATGTGVYNSSTGIQTDGSTNHIVAGFIQSTDAVNADASSSQNNIGYLIYLSENNHGSSAGDLFGGTGASAFNQSRWNQNGTGGWTWKINNGGTVTTASSSFANAKYYMGYRSLSNRQAINVNFENDLINTNASQGVPNVGLYMGAFNNNGTTQNRFAGKFGLFVAFNYNKVQSLADFAVHYRYWRQGMGLDTKEALYPYDLGNQRYYGANDALVVIKIGQSNQNGRATSRPAKLTNVQDAKVFWCNLPLTTITVDNLQFGVNHNLGGPTTENGDELRLAYEAQSRIWPATLAISKYAVGGTAVKFGSPTPNWNLATVGSTNNLIKFATDVVTIPGLQVLDDTKTIKTIILEINQGEADVNGTTEAEFKQAWSENIDYLMTRLAVNGYDLTTIRFHVVFRRVYSGLAGSTVSDILNAIDNMQTYFATNYSSQYALIRTWTTWRTEDYYYSDSVHMGAFGYDSDGIKKALYYIRL